VTGVVAGIKIWCCTNLGAGNSGMLGAGVLRGQRGNRSYRILAAGLMMGQSWDEVKRVGVLVVHMG